MTVRVVVNGGAGKMGRRITALLLRDPQLELVGSVEEKGHELIGSDAGTIAGTGEIGVSITDSITTLSREFDVVIDFSRPKATMEAARIVSEKGRAMVIGTTGFSDNEKARLRDILAPVPCVIAPNMSLGVNVLFKIAEKIAYILRDGFDVEIIEAHHRFKEDAPSGTALRLAEGIAKARNKDNKRFVYGREGRIGSRKSEEIGVLAVRAGDIVGEHTVVFGGVGERIELTHRAHTRDNFAIGALRAAKWVVDQKPGWYDMIDVLGIREI